MLANATNNTKTFEAQILQNVHDDHNPYPPISQLASTLINSYTSFLTFDEWYESLGSEKAVLGEWPQEST